MTAIFVGALIIFVLALVGLLVVSMAVVDAQEDDDV